MAYSRIRIEIAPGAILTPLLKKQIPLAFTNGSLLPGIVWQYFPKEGEYPTQNYYVLMNYATTMVNEVEMP
jgi:hypothetical protein